MNWEMLTAVGQLAAVFVGIPSLIYLAIQIRAQTSERRQSAVNALTVQWGDLTRALHESAEFTAIYLRGLESFSDLDPVSKLRFSALLQSLLQKLPGDVFLALRRDPGRRVLVGRGGADDERPACLSRDAPMVGDKKTLADRRIRADGRCDYCQGTINPRLTRVMVWE